MIYSILMPDSFSWSVVEHQHHDRGFTWYLVATLVGAALIVYALITGNIMFAFIVIIFAIILFILSRIPPKSLVVVAAADGLTVGSRHYTWKDIKNFWIAYDPPEVKSLYIEFAGGFRSRLSLGLDEVDPVAIREFLMQYILEDDTKTEEPFMDWLSRVLKI